MRRPDSLFGAASPSDNFSASLRVGINCLAVAPSFVGGVNTYDLGLLEGFSSAGNGCRFRIFVTEGNQHLLEQFRNRDKFEIVVIGDRLFSLRGKACRAASVSCSSGLYKFTSDSVVGNIREWTDG